MAASLGVSSARVAGAPNIPGDGDLFVKFFTHRRDLLYGVLFVVGEFGEPAER